MCRQPLYGAGPFEVPDCQRIPLAFRHVLRLMNLEFPNDNHHSYIIKDGSKRCKAGVAGLKLLITKERETGIEPATSSLGNWASIENKQQWRLLRPFLNTSTRPVSRFCLFSPS